jgi:hypothetical protein
VTLLIILELSAIVLFLTFLVTQVVVPALKGTRLFPLLDKKRRAAFEALAKARDEEEIDAVRKQTAQVRKHDGEDSNV